MFFVRKIALALLVMSLLIVTACGGGTQQTGNSEQSSSTNKPATGSDSNNTNGENKVEIFSWWTTGGEATGLAALIDTFKKTYPDIEVINATVAGSAGSNAKAVLATRMQGGDPPDLFQVHAGAELNGSWVEAGKMESLNFLYEEEGWNEKFPKELLELISKDGEIYSVPLNVHRGNTMWYNKKIFEDNNLKVPETFEEFFDVATKLQEKGITPFGYGSKSDGDAGIVFDSVLVGTLGPDGYKQLFTGEKRFDSPEVIQAMETYLKMISFANKDHAARLNQDLGDMLLDGKVAMVIAGDWLNGYFTSLGKKPDVDYGFAVAPGNKGVYMFISDTFGLPIGAKHRDNTIKFLKVIGSVEGQDNFNRLKGSIPARVDAGNGDYDVYLKAQMENFKTHTLTPSLAHGSAAKEGFVVQEKDIMKRFLVEKNPQKAAQALQKAAEENGVSK